MEKPRPPQQIPGRFNGLGQIIRNGAGLGGADKGAKSVGFYSHGLVRLGGQNRVGILCEGACAYGRLYAAVP